VCKATCLPTERSMFAALKVDLIECYEQSTNPGRGRDYRWHRAQLNFSLRFLLQPKMNPTLVSEADLGERGNAWLAVCHTRPSSHPPRRKLQRRTCPPRLPAQGSPCERCNHGPRLLSSWARGRSSSAIPSPSRVPHKDYALGPVRRAEAIAKRVVSDSRRGAHM
jgi:hypothetical protein